jgi:hypothetical protein
MDKRNSPRRLGTGSAGSELHSHRNVIHFADEVASCRSCGARFPRRRSEHWKTLCLTCWRYGKAAHALQQAVAYLRPIRRSHD